MGVEKKRRPFIFVERDGTTVTTRAALDAATPTYRVQDDLRARTPIVINSFLRFTDSTKDAGFRPLR